MKSILLSVRPEWVAKILSGEKTVEIRKTAPKCELPVEVYVYCTKGKPLVYLDWAVGKLPENPYEGYVNGKVVASFTLKVINNKDDYLLRAGKTTEDFINEICKPACVDFDYLRKYAKHEQQLYFWHISDLKVFDEPRKLKQFKTLCRHYYGGLSSCEDVCGMYENGECSYGFVPLTRPPQSWQYVEAGK